MEYFILKCLVLRENDSFLPDTSFPLIKNDALMLLITAG